MVKKKVFLKSDKPFYVSDVRCQSEAFSVKATNKPKKMHIVEVTYTADGEHIGRHECDLSFFVRYADATQSSPTADPSGRVKAIIEIDDVQSVGVGGGNVVEASIE